MSEHDHVIVLVDAETDRPRGAWGPYTKRGAESAMVLLVQAYPGTRAMGPIQLRSRHLPPRAAA